MLKGVRYILICIHMPNSTAYYNTCCSAAPGLCTEEGLQSHLLHRVEFLGLGVFCVVTVILLQFLKLRLEIEV